MLAGLAQKFLEKTLDIDVKGPVKGTILEIKEEQGTGTVADAIVHEGSLSVGDELVAGGDPPVVSKVKALFVQGSRGRSESVGSVSAAASVRIVAPGLEAAVSGAPIVTGGDTEELKLEVAAEMESVVELTDGAGVVVKADTLGSLEALSFLLKERKIPVRKAGIGPITKKDVADAETMHEKDVTRAAILGFNVPKASIPSDKVRLFTSDIIYQLLDDYESWVVGQRKSAQMAELDGLVKPCKIELLKGYVFRQSGPAVVGVEVHAGVLRPNTPLMLKDGEQLTFCRGIQHEQETIPEAKKGMRVAASFSDVTIGRQLKEGDVLYTFMPESTFRKYKEFRDALPQDEKDALREIAEIMRVKNPVWGI
jgi:translation initiation factor 5B